MRPYHRSRCINGKVAVHVHGDLTKIWPKSVEMQMGESDAEKAKGRYTTGDLWVIGTDVEAMPPRKGDFYSPQDEEIPVGKDKEYDKSFVPIQNEKPMASGTKSP